MSGELEGEVSQLTAHERALASRNMMMMALAEALRGAAPEELDRLNGLIEQALGDEFDAGVATGRAAPKHR